MIDLLVFLPQCTFLVSSALVNWPKSEMLFWQISGVQFLRATVTASVLDACVCGLPPGWAKLYTSSFPDWFQKCLRASDIQSARMPRSSWKEEGSTETRLYFSDWGHPLVKEQCLQWGGFWAPFNMNLVLNLFNCDKSSLEWLLFLFNCVNISTKRIQSPWLHLQKKSNYGIWEKAEKITRG